MAELNFEYPGGFKPVAPAAADAYYRPQGTDGYASVAAACAAVPPAVRIGRTVLLAGQGEYWWLAPDLSDNGLVRKSAAGLSDEQQAQLALVTAPVRAASTSGLVAGFDSLEEAARAAMEAEGTLANYSFLLQQSMRVGGRLDLQSLRELRGHGSRLQVTSGYTHLGGEIIGLEVELSGYGTLELSGRLHECTVQLRPQKPWFDGIEIIPFPQLPDTASRMGLQAEMKPDYIQPFFYEGAASVSIPAGYSVYATDTRFGPIQVYGELRLGPGAEYPLADLAAYQQSPTTYKTPEGGLIIDERGGTGDTAPQRAELSGNVLPLDVRYQYVTLNASKLDIEELTGARLGRRVRLEIDSQSSDDAVPAWLTFNSVRKDGSWSTVALIVDGVKQPVVVQQVGFGFVPGAFNAFEIEQVDALTFVVENTPSTLYQ